MIWVKASLSLFLIFLSIFGILFFTQNGGFVFAEFDRQTLDVEHNVHGERKDLPCTHQCTLLNEETININEKPNQKDIELVKKIANSTTNSMLRNALNGLKDALSVPFTTLKNFQTKTTLFGSIKKGQPRQEEPKENLQNEKGWQWPCRQRHIPRGGIVCVCNAEYCDRPEPLGLTPEDTKTAAVYTTDASGRRMERQAAKFLPMGDTVFEDTTSSSPDRKNDESPRRRCHLLKKQQKKSLPPVHRTIVVDADQEFQQILGFGGSFSDAAAINWASLSEGARTQLIRTYFHPEQGIGYSMGRVPMASCDFSTREYSYLDTEDDFELKTFTLAEEDLDYKIPMIRAAKEMMSHSKHQNSPTLRLFSSPWSAPGWMKTNGQMNYGGQLKGDLHGPFYQTYAQYFRRFFEEYAKHNVTFWATTIQNEPDFIMKWPSMIIDSAMQRDFVDTLLAPALASSPASSQLLILGHDSNRGNVLKAAEEFFSKNSLVAKEVDGLAFHWYDFAPYDVLQKTHEHYPGKLLLATEACTGYLSWDRGPRLGDWSRAQVYAHDILQSVRHWSAGWVDWNLALDLEGGPNWVQNFVDAPIIVNSTADEFLKQPMFYALAHFSHFVPSGSVRIFSASVDKEDANNGKEAQKKQKDETHSGSEDFAQPNHPKRSLFEHVAFKTPEGKRVLVALNHSRRQEVVLKVREKGRSRGEDEEEEALISLPPNSIVTIVWQQ